MNTQPALRNQAAPAKLNLFLHILGQRSDGYHLLQSVFILSILIFLREKIPDILPINPTEFSVYNVMVNSCFSIL